jgi:multiple sugar transport system permease protein
MQIPILTCLVRLLATAEPLLPTGPAGWDHALYVLWIVNLLATVSVSVFLLRRALRRAPSDLEDAARIDGCGFWRVYWHVMLPLVRPALGFLGLFLLIAIPDDAMAPLIEANGQGPHSGLVVPDVSARGVTISPGGSGVLMACSLLLAPPVIATFFFARRYFQKGGEPAD